MTSEFFGSESDIIIVIHQGISEISRWNLRACSARVYARPVRLVVSLLGKFLSDNKP